VKAARGVARFYTIAAGARQISELDEAIPGRGGGVAGLGALARMGQLTGNAVKLSV